MDFPCQKQRSRIDGSLNDEFSRPCRIPSARAQNRSAKKGGEPNFAFPLLGLFGETGSLLSEVKKKQRDPVACLGYQDSVIEEFGDALWYLAAVSDRANLSLPELTINLDRTISTSESTGSTTLRFQDIEDPAEGLASSPSPAFERTLLQLAAEVGLLMTDYSAGRLDRKRSALKGRLIAIFRALRLAAHEAGITLESAAQANLAKIFDRWPVERVYPALIDNEFPCHEQLPRQPIIDFEELESDGKTMARLTRNGQPVGDPLTDKRADDDDYRFHDVFHLSYAAHLGWSPTLRRLLRVKSKSDARIDEVQDGARAVLIEEGVATWIFNYAQRPALFEGIMSLDYGLLKSVRNVVSGYEAEHCPLMALGESNLGRL